MSRQHGGLIGPSALKAAVLTHSETGSVSQSKGESSEKKMSQSHDQLLSNNNLLNTLYILYAIVGFLSSCFFMQIFKLCMKKLSGNGVKYCKNVLTLGGGGSVGVLIKGRCESAAS